MPDRHRSLCLVTSIVVFVTVQWMVPPQAYFAHLHPPPAAALCCDFVILGTPAERREAFQGKASCIGCARASMLVKPSRARDVKNVTHGGGTRLRCSFGHATHQPPSSVRDRCRADCESFPCAGTEARKSGTENLMPTGPTCGGVAASSDFAILATTAERREAFQGKASCIGCARASMLLKPTRARDVKNVRHTYRGVRCEHHSSQLCACAGPGSFALRRRLVCLRSNHDRGTGRDLRARSSRDSSNRRNCISLCHRRGKCSRARALSNLDLHCLRQGLRCRSVALVLSRIDFGGDGLVGDHVRPSWLWTRRDASKPTTLARTALLVAQREGNSRRSRHKISPELLVRADEVIE